MKTNQIQTKSTQEQTRPRARQPPDLSTFSGKELDVIATEQESQARVLRDQPDRAPQKRQLRETLNLDEYPAEVLEAVLGILKAQQGKRDHL